MTSGISFCGCHDSAPALTPPVNLNLGHHFSDELQWCPDISPGPVQPDNWTIRGVGHKTVNLLIGLFFGLNRFTFRTV